MIYILNNIKFGHPKLFKHQIEFFEKYFRNTIYRNPNRDDKIIINGDLFYNTKHTTFEMIQKVKNIFDYDVPIEIVNNNYCLSLFNMKQIKELKYDIGDVSLFQLSKDNIDKIGFYIIKDDKMKFVVNKYSPRFVEYKIKSVEDLQKIEITKDFIDLEIDSELLNKSEYKNKIDIFLNNNSFNNVFYTEKKKEDNKVIIDTRNINIRNIIYDNIDDDLRDELKTIFTIYDEK